MTVEQAIKTILTANAGVSALVGTRVSPGALSQTTLYPAISYVLRDRDAVERLEAPGRSGLARSRFVFFSVVKGVGGYAQAKAVAEALRLALDGYHGTVTLVASSPVETCVVQRIELTQQGEGWDDATQTHQVISVFNVWAEESRP